MRGDAEDVRWLEKDAGVRAPRASPLDDLEKLVFIVHTLRRWRWTLSTLLEALAQHRDRPEFRISYRDFQDLAYIRVMKSDLGRTITSSQWQEIMNAEG